MKLVYFGNRNLDPVKTIQLPKHSLTAFSAFKALLKILYEKTLETDLGKGDVKAVTFSNPPPEKI